ncbi:MAG: D-alanine--D-alanine ligase [Bacteroidales bacterium]|jgi:D-alanine-D-alanine ligase|nr:D-alanine--D-alanine ligase [Bacteroidales bacterium]
MKKIAIVAGGDSSEYVVSLRSAQGIWSFVDHSKYETSIIVIKGTEWKMVQYDGKQYDWDKTWPVDREDFSVVMDGVKLTFDFAYIIIHGTPGENGILQGYFDMIRMPYSCCGVLAAALTCSKFTCNRYLSTFGIPVAKSILLHVGEEVDTEQCVKELGLPVFVKPNAGGSSYATTKVKTPEELQPAIAAAKREATGEVIIESFMQGTEVTCGCYTSRDGLRALPITEVVSKKEFFDVDAKYNGAVEEITPARISDEMTQKIQALTRRIYGYVGAKGIIRVDYIIIGDTPHLLEVNTTPGMTATSFIPQEVRAAGLDISDVMDDVITFGSL